MHGLRTLHPLLQHIETWLLGPVMALYRAAFRNSLGEMVKKTDGTYAGKLDNAIAQSCRNAFQNHCEVVTEEDAVIGWPPQSGKRTLLLDPLDGTHNEGMGWLSFGTQFILVEDGIPTLSVILRPGWEGLTHTGINVAIKGTGAYRYNSSAAVLHRLQISSEANLERACVLFEGPPRTQKAHPGVERVKQLSCRHRVTPSCAESGVLIAHGNLVPLPAHALVAVANKPWDNLPPALLIEEAGGKVTDFQGNPWGLQARDVVAANPILHAAILAAMRNEKE